MYKYIVIIILPFLMACNSKQGKNIVKEEDFEAKSMLQGIWLDENTESPMLKIEGDSIYYLQNSINPVAFKVIDDSLITYGVHTTSYHIEEQSTHTLWLESEIGDLIQLAKADEDIEPILIAQPEPEVSEKALEVIQKDQVVFYKNTRYRGYVYINPSQIKVIRPEYSEEGFKVDNVYYDNVIHICVYEGKNKLFGKDIFKTDFKGVVPDEFLQWAILSDMEFIGVNEQGYHYQATVCIPDKASCYLVNIHITPEGEISYVLEE